MVIFVTLADEFTVSDAFIVQKEKEEEADDVVRRLSIHLTVKHSVIVQQQMLRNNNHNHTNDNRTKERSYEKKKEGPK